ncbi:MAG: TnpV protein, partial [Clostridia bacterium]|nr:TnpV protein [Clostridia bacterium]
MKNELTYTKVGDYNLPNLTLQNPESQPLGRYGRMRREYLKNHRPVLYNRLIISEKRFSKLTEIE